MKLLSLCLLAAVFAASAAPVPTMTLIYRGSVNQDMTMNASYGECTAVVTPEGMYLVEVLYPVKSTCSHFKDAQCTQPSSVPPATHMSGYSHPAATSGFAKCQPS